MRNIPFQAHSRELRELFNTFGELKTVHLPKEMTRTDTEASALWTFSPSRMQREPSMPFVTAPTCTARDWCWSGLTEVTLQALQWKTAAHFHEPQKKKWSVVLDEILEQLEGSDSERKPPNGSRNIKLQAQMPISPKLNDVTPGGRVLLMCLELCEMHRGPLHRPTPSPAFS
ncbi:hypothetical protein P7K49_023504 [Saguinus oedipus]|uniref:RRM domain-containing protein n=1 Tax=Saguinus oedipus TaxID=9490 RepID=A0ABQ9ULY1_SAGOE|nr:hypothetical protein P7K49_023504 [Saguinus oedipus]